MNLPYELSKIRDAFRRVRDDLDFMKGKISQNFDDFMVHHKDLAHKVEALSNEMKQHLDSAKHSIISNNNSSPKEIHDLKLEFKELKKHILALEKEHNELSEDVKSRPKPKNYDSEFKSVKEKIHSNELEMYLLKERIIEKDLEVKQLRDVNQRLFEIVDELAKAEMELANR